MKMLNRHALMRCHVEALQRHGVVFGSTLQRFKASTPRLGFTLIELILVLALLVVITSIAVPGMARFVRGRALDSEARRMIALMHAAQSRAVSEGAPMMFWINEKTGTYGLMAETNGQNGDPKAEDLMLDSTLTLAVMNVGMGAPTMFNNLPAIRFLADGTVDENSPQALKLTDSDGFSRVLVETKLRTGYEVQ